MNINNLKTGKKLFLGFGAMSVLLVVMAFVSWWEMTALDTSMDGIILQAGKLRTVMDIGADLDGLYLKMWGLVTATDDKERQADLSEIEKLRASYRKRLGELKDA